MAWDYICCDTRTIYVYCNKFMEHDTIYVREEFAMHVKYLRVHGMQIIFAHVFDLNSSA